MKINVKGLGGMRELKMYLFLQKNLVFQTFSFPLAFKKRPNLQSDTLANWFQAEHSST